MAALRYSRPGEPTLLVDIGPSYGRAYAGSYQGDLVTGVRNAPRILPATTPKRQAQMAAYKAARRAQTVCGHVMKSRIPCAGGIGHAGQHRSRAYMDRKAASKRAVR